MCSAVASWTLGHIPRSPAQAGHPLNESAGRPRFARNIHLCCGEKNLCRSSHFSRIMTAVSVRQFIFVLRLALSQFKRPSSQSTTHKSATRNTSYTSRTKLTPTEKKKGRGFFHHQQENISTTTSGDPIFRAVVLGFIVPGTFTMDVSQEGATVKHVSAYRARPWPARQKGGKRVKWRHNKRRAKQFRRPSSSK